MPRSANSFLPFFLHSTKSFLITVLQQKTKANQQLESKKAQNFRLRCAKPEKQSKNIDLYQISLQRQFFFAFFFAQIRPRSGREFFFAFFLHKSAAKRQEFFFAQNAKTLKKHCSGDHNFSKETGIPIVADSAESLGAMYKNKQVGTQLVAHSFSFFANKNITTAEGGMVVTNNEALYEKLKIIRNQGQEGRYNHTYLGNNYRMSDVLAAIGIEQLKRLDTILSKKQKVACRRKLL